MDTSHPTGVWTPPSICFGVEKEKQLCAAAWSGLGGGRFPSEKDLVGTPAETWGEPGAEARENLEMSKRGSRASVLSDIADARPREDALPSDDARDENGLPGASSVAPSTDTSSSIMMAASSVVFLLGMPPSSALPLCACRPDLCPFLRRGSSCDTARVISELETAVPELETAGRAAPDSLRREGDPAAEVEAEEE